MLILIIISTKTFLMKPLKNSIYKHTFFGYTFSEKSQHLHKNIAINIDISPLLDFPSLVFLG